MLALEQRLVPGPVDVVPVAPVPAPAPAPVPVLPDSAQIQDKTIAADLPATGESEVVVNSLTVDDQKQNAAPVKDLTTAPAPQALPVVEPELINEILYYKLR